MASEGCPMPKRIPADAVRYCGRPFTREEIERIRSLVAAEPRPNRAQLSRMLCEALNWVRPNGTLKDMSCRVAMLRMEKDGLIELPSPQNGNGNGAARPRLSEASAPGQPITDAAGRLGKLQLCPVSTPQQSSLWNELIQRHHYLATNPFPALRSATSSSAPTASSLPPSVSVPPLGKSPRATTSSAGLPSNAPKTFTSSSTTPGFSSCPG